MFGYVKPEPGDLLVREYEYYRAAYCGLCRTMRRRTGLLSAASLSYELLLLALVRMLWGDPDTPVKRRRCPLHPLKKRAVMEENPALLYAARVSALLSYYKVRDDMADDRGLRRAGATLACPVFAHARRRAALGEADAAIRSYLDRLAKIEQDRVPSVDAAAQIFGEMLGGIFAASLEGSSALVAREFGLRLGRFIYAADAAEDYEKDKKSGSYNPYVLLWGGRPLTPAQRADIHTALLLELRGLESAMNLLPQRGQDALFHIISNTVCEGLPRRIRFLLAEDESPASSTRPESEDKS